jgi:hypothetical protein
VETDPESPEMPSAGEEEWALRVAEDGETIVLEEAATVPEAMDGCAPKAGEDAAPTAAGNEAEPAVEAVDDMLVMTQEDRTS